MKSPNFQNLPKIGTDIAQGESISMYTITDYCAGTVISASGKTVEEAHENFHKRVKEWLEQRNKK